MFEKISKGEFYVEDVQVYGLVKSELETICEVYTKSKAEFIAYCFNLHQRYDISKLEEAVRLLETQISCLNAGFDITANSVLHEEIKVILKQIKK